MNCLSLTISLANAQGLTNDCNDEVHEHNIQSKEDEFDLS